MVTRREFIKGAGVVTLLAAGCSGPKAVTTKPIGIIDTHTHFYDTTRLGGIPWPPANDKVLHRPVLPSEFEALTKPLGVESTIVVEASPRVEDNDWVLALAGKHNIIRGFVGHLKPGQAGFSQNLNRLAMNKKFRGIRTGGWGISVASQQGDFVKDLRLLADRDLSLDVLCGSAQIPAVTDLASKIPQLRIVINHCGGVKVDGTTPATEWKERVSRAAERANVHMKVSGLVEATGKEGSAPNSLDYYRPALDFLWSAFGGERVIYGSNWPVSNRFAPYSQVLSIVKTYFGEKGRPASVKYFRDNAMRVYKV